jgi:arylsulfatase A-like enzyme
VNFKRTSTCATALAGAFLFSVSGPLWSQQPDRTTLPIPPAPFQGTIGRDLKDSTQVPTKPLSAPKGAPNVLLILMDDAGFGQTSAFGGMVPTPTLEGLAANGLKYTHFHVQALCSPTRASLMTGRNNHMVGMGTITDWANGYPGYTGSIPKSAAFVSEILRENGYATASIGKWHLVPDAETTLSGPFDHWPTHQGFDYYYGFIGAATDQWHPELTEGTKPIEMVSPPGREKDYTLNEDLADHARAWILQQKGLDPDRPIFMYYATGGTHVPLQAPRAWIDKFKGKFDMGWDKYREMVLERQKKLGVVPPDTKLTARPEELPAWDSLTPVQKKVASRLMEVFAGFMAQTDYQIGRVIDTLREVGQLDNTMIIYIAGDNGASMEGNIGGTDNIVEQANGIFPTAEEIMKHIDDLGGEHSNPHYPAAWAWAGDTPFQWGKRIGSHFGGTQDPMVISWPGHEQNPGGTRSQYTHVIDVLPTILEAAGVPQPTEVDGVKQQRIDGVSFLDSLENANAPEHHTVQYSEMHGNVSIYQDGWIAAQRTGLVPWAYTEAPPPEPLPWELYHVSQDFSEADNLAAANPEKLAQMEKLFVSEAERNQVFPIDPRFAGRPHPNPAPPGGRAFYTFYRGSTHLYEALAPATRNRTHTFTCYIDMPASGAEGVLVAEGGEASGYSIYVKDGRANYVYNYFRHDLTTITSKDKLPVRKSIVEVHFQYDGGGLGKGATVTMTVNGKPEGSARLEHTASHGYNFEETFDVGEDSASAVGPYKAPFPFTGGLEKVEVRSEAPPKLAAADAAKEFEAQKALADLKD